jgi:hypothetical protein
MTTFLSGVIVSLLSSIAGYLVHYFQVMYAGWQQKTAAEAATQAAVNADKNANTTQERDDAAKGVVDNI